MTEVQPEADRYAHLRTRRSTAALRGIVWSTVNSLVPSAVAAGVFLFSSRVLQPVDFGLVAFAVSVSSVAGAFGLSGFGDALIQRKDLDESHLTTVFWLCLAAGLFVFALICAIAVPLADYTEHPLFEILLPVTGLKVLFDAALPVPNALLSRSMSFHLVALRTTIASIVAGAVCVVMLLLGFGLWALALSQVAASAASCVGALAAAGWRPRGRPTRQAFQELQHYGFYTSGTNLLQFIYPEHILIGALMGPAALGIYGFARRIFQILNDVIAGALGSVSYALLASLQAEREKLRQAFLAASFASASCAFAVFGGLAAIAPDGVPLVFGNQWIPAIPSVQLFCILGVISSVGYIQASLIKSAGQANWWFWYQLVKRAVMTITVFASYQFGVTAIVGATVLATVVLFPSVVAKSAAAAGIGLRTYLAQYAPPAVAAAIMFGAVWLFRDAMPDIGVTLRLLASIAIGGVSYCGVLALLSYRRLIEIGKLVRRRKSSPA